MKRIVLHIGYGKTGTTAIQGALAANRGLLAENGIHYPKWHDFVERDNHNGIAKCLTYQHHAHFLDGFFRELHQVSAETLVLSGETLAIYPERGTQARPQVSMIDGSVFQRGYRADPDWQLKKRDLIGQLKGLLPDADEVRVVVFLRRQDRWIESIYNEDVKGGYTNLPFHEFGEYYKNCLHYDQQIGLWADAFGAENIDVRVYEKQQLGPGVVHQFFEAGQLAGKMDSPAALASALKSPENRTPNPRLTDDALAYRRKLNGRIAWMPELLWGRANSWARQRAEARSAKAGKGELFTKQGIMDDNTRREFLDGFAAGNAAIARNYLGREDGVLFRDEL
ncbi:MAG: hypothetical protein ACJAZ8_000136 [Planctomycetota bacterium]|jgi:hypothetical protein